MSSALPSEQSFLRLINQLGGGQGGWVDEKDICDAAIGPPGSRGEKEPVLTRKLREILATAVEEGHLEVRTWGCFIRFYRRVRT
jgi:hypothetical protein